MVLTRFETTSELCGHIFRIRRVSQEARKDVPQFKGLNATPSPEECSE